MYKLHTESNLLVLQQDPSTSIDIMYQYGVWYIGDHISYLHRLQVIILHAHLGLWKKEGNPPSSTTLLNAIESILVPAAVGDINEYRRKLRKLFTMTTGDNQYRTKKLVSELEPGKRSRTDHTPQIEEEVKKKTKTWFPGDPPKKGV